MSVPSPAVPAQPTPTTPSRKPPATARSIGFTPSSATDNDWRQSPSSTPTTANGINAKGPGKTIGGFEKKSMKDLKDYKKDKDKEDKDKSKLLSSLDHVPCRFFKQGACTAGDSCPFSHSMPERKSAIWQSRVKLTNSWKEGDLSMVPKGKL
jgi:cleavage and polyadenylation specificity factor subunit 4